MVEALKARGIEVPYIVKRNEGHGFSNEENRFEFYSAMEEFQFLRVGSGFSFVKRASHLTRFDLDYTDSRFGILNPQRS